MGQAFLEAADAPPKNYRIENIWGPDSSSEFDSQGRRLSHSFSAVQS